MLLACCLHSCILQYRIANMLHMLAYVPVEDQHNRKFAYTSILAYLHASYFDTNIVANMHTLACQRICSRILETFLLAYLQAGILAFLHNSIQYVNTGTQTYKRTIKIYTTILAYLSILANMHTLAYYCLCSQILENILTCIL